MNENLIVKQLYIIKSAKKIKVYQKVGYTVGRHDVRETLRLRKYGRC